MSEQKVTDMTFEAAMAELEAVVAELEKGDVALEKSIDLYARGAELKAHCEGRLKAAEEKVAAISFDETGAPKGTTSVDTQ